MRNNNVWEINMHEQFIRYEEESCSVLYPDSRYYRKDKPKFELHDDGRIYIPDSNENADLS